MPTLTTMWENGVEVDLDMQVAIARAVNLQYEPTHTTMRKTMSPHKKLTDFSLMPFGQHRGRAMEDVPAEYLLWLLNDGIQPGQVRDYIERNREAIDNEVSA